MEGGGEEVGEMWGEEGAVGGKESKRSKCRRNGRLKEMKRGLQEEG